MQEIVNWYGTRRHFADPGSSEIGGAVKALCGRTWGYTEESHARVVYRIRPLKIHTRPMCKYCQRMASTQKEDAA